MIPENRFLITSPLSVVGEKVTPRQCPLNVIYIFKIWERVNICYDSILGFYSIPGIDFYPWTRPKILPQINQPCVVCEEKELRINTEHIYKCSSPVQIVLYTRLYISRSPNHTEKKWLEMRNPRIWDVQIFLQSVTLSELLVQFHLTLDLFQRSPTVVFLVQGWYSERDSIYDMDHKNWRSLNCPDPWLSLGFEIN